MGRPGGHNRDGGFDGFKLEEESLLCARTGSIRGKQ
jgi:hypothetical protein